MAAFLDVCRFIPTAGGTSAWTFASAVGGYQSPGSAGAVNGTKYKYRAESTDLTQWEIGEGTWNSSTGALSRTTVLFNSSGTGTAAGQSGAGTLINFGAVPQVAIVALAEDLLSPDGSNGFSGTQQANMRSAIGALGSVRVQIFTSSGTYTPSPGMLYCIIECVGGGGGAGGVAGASGYNLASGGAGSGAYSKKTASAATVGASQVVAVGAAGAGGAAGANSGASGASTSVGSICTAPGGGPSSYCSAASSSPGGSPASVGIGDVAINGAYGFDGIYWTGVSASTGVGAFSGGQGGDSFYGTGGRGGFNGPGAVGTGYGAGGGGASSSNAANNYAGGNGTAGIVIITEFCAV